MNFDVAKQAHDAYDFSVFNDDIMYLLLNQFMKSGNKVLQQKFLRFIDFCPSSTKVTDKFREVFYFCQENVPLERIENFINDNREEAIWYDDDHTLLQLQELR